MALMGFLTTMRGVSFPLIKTGFGVSYNDMGLMNSLTSFFSIFFCILAGVFMNRYGLKKNLLIGYLIFIAGTGSLYFASGFWITVWLYLIFQAGYGFLNIGLNGMGVRIFTLRSGLMINLLHFFYGAGAIFGPRFMGVMVNRGMRWQDVYPLGLFPLIIILLVLLVVRFPENPRRVNDNGDSAGKTTFWAMFADPRVWLFGITMGIGNSIDVFLLTWSGLYLLDVYGLDPSITGAAIISAFFMLYTLSRFISGFIIEKTGYLRSVIVSSLMIIVLFALAFGLGRRGIYLFAVVGFFTAIIWPTLLAIAAKVFKEQAQTASSAIFCISSTLGGIIHYGVGLTNRFIGAAWGFRSCIIYCIILVVLLFRLKRIRGAEG